MTARLNSTSLRALAAGSRCTGSSRGTKVDRAGDSIANSPDCAATTTYSSSVLSLPSAACTTSTTASSRLPVLQTRTSVRRSTASATAPPYSPNTMSGTSPATPTSPTAAAERVCA